MSAAIRFEFVLTVMTAVTDVVITPPRKLMIATTHCIRRAYATIQATDGVLCGVITTSSEVEEAGTYSLSCARQVLSALAAKRAG